MTFAIKMTHEDVAAAELARLPRAHLALDAEIAALSAQGSVCSFEIQPLKRQKLKLKGEIRARNDRLTPDIIV